MDLEVSNKSERGEKEKSKNFQSLETLLRVGGLAGILFGFIHVWGLVSQGFTYIQLGDAIFNILFGILFLISKRLLSQEKFSAMWAVTLSVLLSMIYSFIVGRGINYIIALIGVGILIMFTQLKKNNELS